jgi:vacuolar-type H+-ATPase catalytic subunit A/Vma1
MEGERVNYVQVVEGSAMYYEWYVKLIQQENTDLKQKISNLKEISKSMSTMRDFVYEVGTKNMTEEEICTLIFNIMVYIKQLNDILESENKK